jgi:hypothetical protein
VRRQPFTIFYEQASEVLSTYAVHAIDEADALAHADAFFAAHPEHDFREGRVGLSVRVERGFRHAQGLGSGPLT